MKDTYVKKIQKSANYIQSYQINKPEIGLILGSGLGALADQVENPQVIPYSKIPHFPHSTVKGHSGQLIIGNLQGKSIVAMKGRFHYYEGYSMETITLPLRVMIELGINTLIVTNAAGGVNKKYSPGDLMIITDHINFSFDNPLIGKNKDVLGTRFPDMSSAYCQDLIQIARSSAKQLNLNVHNGIYTYLTGPTYETPAEVSMIKTIGGDAVGMSTVPEVIVAVHGNVKVLGISCITNMAAGILDKPLNHAEVIDTASKTEQNFINYIKQILNNI